MESSKPVTSMSLSPCSAPVSPAATGLSSTKDLLAAIQGIETAEGLFAVVKQINDQVVKDLVKRPPPSFEVFREANARYWAWARSWGRDLEREVGFKIMDQDWGSDDEPQQSWAPVLASRPGVSPLVRQQMMERREQQVRQQQERKRQRDEEQDSGSKRQRLNRGL